MATVVKIVIRGTACRCGDVKPGKSLEVRIIFMDKCGIQTLIGLINVCYSSAIHVADNYSKFLVQITAVEWPRNDLIPKSQL